MRNCYRFIREHRRRKNERKEEKHENKTKEDNSTKNAFSDIYKLVAETFT